MGAGWTDVHRDMGFGCMSCHTLGDVHGDGNEYDGLQDIGAIDANCETCHTDPIANHPADVCQFYAVGGGDVADHNTTNNGVSN